MANATRLGKNVLRFSLNAPRSTLSFLYAIRSTLYAVFFYALHALIYFTTGHFLLAASAFWNISLTLATTSINSWDLATSTCCLL